MNQTAGVFRAAMVAALLGSLPVTGLIHLQSGEPPWNMLGLCWLYLSILLVAVPVILVTCLILTLIFRREVQKLATKSRASRCWMGAGVGALVYLLMLAVPSLASSGWSPSASHLSLISWAILTGGIYGAVFGAILSFQGAVSNQGVGATAD